MARRYESNPKHKLGPQQHGSLCPEELSLEDCQVLLERALPDPRDEPPRSLWVFEHGWVFRARPTDPDRDIWHGYPVPGCEIPKEVMRQFREVGWLDRRGMRALYQQRTLPEVWPAEVS